MKTHLLRYFVAVAEERHFGRAAARLSITQPPLSVALKNLEADLGVVLLERDSKNVVLTPAGEAFLHEARKVLAQLQHASDVARRVGQGHQGMLEIGITASMIYRRVPEFLQAFKQQRPLVEVSLREMSTQEQIEAIQSGQIDAGFLNISHPNENYATLSIGSEPLLCCVSDKHPLAASSSIDLKALGDETFVMFARNVAPANYDNVIACLEKSGIHPKTRHAARQWLTVVAMVSAEQGVALVPANMAQAGLLGVKFIPLQGPQSYTPAVLAWLKHNDSPLLRAFSESVRAFCEAHPEAQRPS